MTQIQLRDRGVITIPVDLREKYDLDSGDAITIIDVEGGFFISPDVSVVPKLAEHIEELRSEYDISVDELIEGVAEERKKYYRNRIEDE